MLKYVILIFWILVMVNQVWLTIESLKTNGVCFNSMAQGFLAVVFLAFFLFYIVRQVKLMRDEE